MAQWITSSKCTSLMVKFILAISVQYQKQLGKRLEEESMVVVWTTVIWSNRITSSPEH